MIRGVVVRMIALVAAAPLLLVTAPAQAQAATLDVSWQVTDEQSRVVKVRVHNDSSQDLSGWQVTLPLGQPVTDVSGAISIQDSDQLTLSSSVQLPAGDESEVVLTVDPLGAPVTSPTWCSSPGGDCEVSAEPGPTSWRTPEWSTSDVLALTYRVTADWGTGQSVVMSVTNNGPTATSDWQVDVRAGVQVTQMWGATNLSGGGTLRVANDDSNGYLAPGETLEFGFDVTPGGTAEWRDCRAFIDGIAASCGVSAARSWASYPQLPSQW